MKHAAKSESKTSTVIRQKSLQALQENITDLQRIIKILQDDRSRTLKPLLDNLLEFAKLMAKQNGIDPIKIPTSSWVDQDGSDFKQLRGMIVGVQTLSTLCDLNQMHIPEISKLLMRLSEQYEIKFIASRIIPPPMYGS